MVDLHKTQLSVFIGFLFLILLGLVFYLFQSAVHGGLIARWVLFLVFGTLAVVLTSFGIGYVILLLTRTQGTSLHHGKEITYRRIARQPQQGTWIDLSQLPSSAVQQRPTKQAAKRRSVKKKRR